VVETHGGVGLGVVRLQTQRALEAGVDLAANALLERLDDGDRLTVPAEVEGMEIMAVGVIRIGVLRRFGAVDGCLEAFDTAFFVVLEVVGIDSGRLVRGGVGGQSAWSPACRPGQASRSLFPLKSNALSS